MAERVTQSLLEALPASVRRSLVAVCTSHRFHKGHLLFEEDQPARSVWIVEQGCVYLVKHTPQGGVATIFVITPHEALCGISALDHGRYSAGAVAATEAVVLEIPSEMFVRLLRTYPQFMARVLLICCNRMRHMAEAISVGQAPVPQRLAYALLRLRSTFGNTIPVTHQELAQMAGTRWETSIRTIASFKRKHWLSTSRGKMTILRPDQLKTLLAPSARNHFTRHEDGQAPIGEG